MIRFSHVSPWMFAVTAIPYGVVSAFVLAIMPYVLRRAGISVEQIGWFSVATAIPVFAQFLYTPIVDFKFRRKIWLFLSALFSTVSLIGALLTPLPQKSGIFLILTLLAQFATMIIGACNGGLMATLLTPQQQAKASGWYSFGNLGGGALGVSLILSLAEKAPLYVVCIIGGILILGPALFALLLPEPAFSAGIRSRQRVRQTFQELWQALRSKTGWSGILFCITPVGTVALTSGFSSIAPDYHAGPGMVAFVNGAMGALVTGLGSLVASYLNQRFNKRKMYLVIGISTALVGIGMAVSPLSQLTYTIGVIIYFFIAGISYAILYGIVLETISRTDKGVSTYYTLFMSVANLAIAYVIFINTRYYHLHGPRALLISDAVLNVIGVIFLGILIKVIFPKGNEEMKNAHG